MSSNKPDILRAHADHSLLSVFIDSSRLHSVRCCTAAGVYHTLLSANTVAGLLLSMHPLLVLLHFDGRSRATEHNTTRQHSKLDALLRKLTPFMIHL